MTASNLHALDQARTLELVERHLSPARARFYRALDEVPLPVGSEGVFVFDAEGADLIDCRSAGGVFNLGHRSARIRRLVVEGLDHVDIGDWLLPSAVRAEAARAIAESVPGSPSLVTFCTSGGEAVDVACDLARRRTGRTRLVAALGAYHGQIGTAALLSQAGTEDTRAGSAEVTLAPFGDIDAAIRAIDDTVAACVIEPIQAAAGVITPPENYLHALRQRCDQVGALLVVDEVQTGLGRTGSLWAVDHFGIAPDILVTGKGLSGGVYPVAACVYTAEVGESVADTPFFRPSSFGGSELGARIAGEVVAAVRDEEFLVAVRARGNLLLDGLTELKGRFPKLFAAARGVGLMCALEIDGSADLMGFVRQCWSAGLLVSPAPNHPSAVLVMPPLVITDNEVGLLLDRLFEAAAATAG